MKSYFIILFLFFSCTAWSQLLKKRDVRRLGSFGMDLRSLDAHGQRAWDDVRAIIDKDTQYRRRIKISIVWAALSVVPLSLGAFLLTAAGPPTGVFFVTAGVLTIGCLSIPLFVSAKHKARERGKLIIDYYRHY